MKSTCLAVAGGLMLCSCEIPADPDKRPVILSCTGEETAKGANGDQERERKREVYRIDGSKGTFEQWDDRMQSFGFPSEGLTVTSTEARYSRDGPVLAGIGSTRIVTFDRVGGSVEDERLMSNGGSVTFSGVCKPVQEVDSGRKF